MIVKRGVGIFHDSGERGDIHGGEGGDWRGSSVPWKGVKKSQGGREGGRGSYLADNSPCPDRSSR